MQSNDRLHALDAVRAFALLSGIALHATMPYLQDLKGWVVTDKPSAVMAGVWYFIHMFRMPVFFLMAGFFGRMMLERRGVTGFIKDRSKRIILPLVVGLPVVMIASVIAYVLGALATGNSLQDLRAAAQQQSSQAGPNQGINLAHLWFLYYLIYFYAGALALRTLGRALDRGGRLHRALDAVIRFLMRGPWGPVLLAVPMVVYYYQYAGWPGWTGLPAPFSIVPDPGALIAYGLIFGCGWCLQRQPELLMALDRRWMLYGIPAILLAAACWSVGGSTPHWAPYLKGAALMTYTPSYMVATWCWTFAIIGLAVRYLSAPSAVRRYIADSSYWLYLMHVPVLVFFDMLVHPMHLPWSAKYLLSLLCAVPILLLTYHYWVRFTFIGATLNGRRRPRGHLGSATPTPA